MPVRILNVSASEAKTLAIIENLQREDLNPIEETEGILELLQLNLEREKDYVLSLLYKMNKEHDNVIISESEIVENTFKSLGKLKWESFVINRLRLLNLPDLILSAIRKGQIEYTKGITIARVKDPDLIKQLLDKTIENNLSLNEVKAEIAQLNNKNSGQDYTKLSTEELVQNIRQTYQKFSRNQKIWSNQKNRKKIEALLKQLEKLTND